ncbi:hypothetical protein [Hymenobacter arizonensis]|uniref:Uncharacterized protein n=1 Tax=Hymenobacter arizonensis TaxID=1227077 RepID=A0A1I6BCN4_HYMAR|nr:hypothetical protein [Hymenobacter arizonensis]SFQ78715.1 hypothetical protein SAMN04515668_4354 [Hymenobacter arizonensis]
MAAGVLLMGLAGLPAFQGKPRPLPDTRARKITMYYLPIHSFVRYPIDSSLITYKHQLEQRVRKPDQFLSRLRTSLGQAPAAASFGHQYLRVLYAVTYTDGSQQKIVVDAGGNVFWNGRSYKGSRALDHVLESPITPHNRERLGMGPDGNRPGK